MNLLLVVLWNLVAAPAAPSFTAGADTLAVDLPGWLAGCWESRTGDRVTFEMWSPAAGDLMVGAGRTVVGGSARAFEHLRIQGTPDGLVYTAIPSGQTETDFTSTSVTADGFVVENPEHDFPTRITYRRVGEDAYTAQIEGPGEDGSMGGFGIAFTRVACEVGGAG